MAWQEHRMKRLEELIDKIPYKRQVWLDEEGIGFQSDGAKYGLSWQYPFSFTADCVLFGYKFCFIGGWWRGTRIKTRFLRPSLKIKKYKGNQ